MSHSCTHEHHHAHEHEQSHENHHGHHHAHEVSQINQAFFIALSLNILFVGVETFFGFKTQSLALLSDAGHNAMDVVNLALSALALWLTQKGKTSLYTYGYKRASILSALINSLLLILTSLYLIYEAVQRFLTPVETVGSTMMIVATVGIVVNGISAWLLTRQSREDINIKSASLHLVWDALVSLGVVLAGALILFTGYTFIDPLVSIVVSLIMMASVMGLLRQSIRMSFDGVPESLDIDTIRKDVLRISDVVDFHHIHIWSLSTTEHALTAHVLIKQWSDEHAVKKALRSYLAGKNIHHVTLETDEEICHNRECQ